MDITTEKTNQIIFCVALLVIVSGCTDFLTKSDPSNFTTKTYYNTADQAKSAVNAIYGSLPSIYGGGGYNGSPWEMLEFATGEANNGSPQATFSTNIRELKQSPRNGYVSTWWNSSYRGIANANEAITHIPDIKMDDTQKEKLMGEARFLRAYYYFNLVRIFGKVPLITKPVNLNSPELKAPQADVQEVYNLIIEDLTAAEKAVLPFSNENGRVTLGAVKSLLSSVYLTMAGYPLQKGSDYYKKASDEAKEVIDSGEYKLFDSYDDLHNPSKENIGENIFMIQFKKSVQQSNIQTQILPFEKGISAYSAETGSIYPTKAFVESYQVEDKRKQEKQFFYTQFTSESDRSETVKLGNYYIYKLFDIDANLNSADSGLNWPVLRYAEVLLIYAEAENEVSGPTPSAYEAVNKIRSRANLPNLSGLNKSEFRKAVWKERWHELCFENKTWFDMVRLRKALNVSSGTFEDFVGHKFSYGPTLSKRDLLFPVPDSEIRNNENLTQNQGY